MSTGTMESIREDELALPGVQRLKDPYRNDIDGLRAIAVTSVVLFHAGLSTLPGGFVGVDIFFVISGYLIGAHIYRDVSRNQFSLVDFYRLRAKRILPALFTVLLFCYGTSFVVLSPIEMRRFGGFAVSSLLSFSNILAWHQWNYFSPSAMQNPLLMTWSLGVEEQFYVFFPLLMLLLARFARKKGRSGEQTRRIFLRMVLAAAAVSCLLSVVATSSYLSVEFRRIGSSIGGQREAFYWLPYRAWELAAGVLMALYEAGPSSPAEAGLLYGGSRLSNLRGLAGAAAIFFSIFFYGPGTVFPGPGAILPVAGAVLILSAPDAWMNRKILSSKPFRWIGLVSYSWYLWHWPLMSFPSIIVDKPLGSKTLLWFALAALGCAFLSYRFIEQPFRKSKMAAAPLLWRSGAACLVLALPAIFMTLSGGFPSRFPALAVDEKPIIFDACFGELAPRATQTCLPKPDGRPAVALVGDSHALVIAPTMRALANAAGMRLLTMTHAACPPLIGVIPNVPGSDYDLSCKVFYDAALKLAANDPSVQTVVLAAHWAEPAISSPAGYGFVPFDHRRLESNAESDANLEQGLESMVSQLKRAGKRVVLMQDVDTLKFDPQRRIRSYRMPLRSWLARQLQGPEAPPGAVPEDEMYAKENAAAAVIIAQVARQEGAEIFDMRKGLCAGAKCVVYADEHLIYNDVNHVSQRGAELALRGFPIAPPPNSGEGSRIRGPS
jgi:peptidoglycan/LPS O-acetylase OafA/YrhL